MLRHIQQLMRVGLILCFSIGFWYQAAACDLNSLDDNTVAAMKEAIEAGGIPVFNSQGKLTGAYKGNELIGCGGKRSNFEPRQSQIKNLKYDQKCIFEFYQYRSPSIDGCEFSITKGGIEETFTYIKNGQFGRKEVYTGLPTYSPKSRDKNAHVQSGCPAEVVTKINKDLKNSELKSWANMKTSVKNEMSPFFSSDMRTATVKLGKSGSEIIGYFDLLGMSSQLSLKEQNDRGISLVGELQSGVTVQFKTSPQSTLSVISFSGALDFRGGC